MLAQSRVIVGMSGGVDSSVAALLLKQQGYTVEGLFMKNWEEDDTETHCSSAEDIRVAESVCNQLDIPLHTVNFSTEYWEQVFENFLAEYRAGRTPNPDILCNREIKFKVFLNYALSLGADFIATGHYAKKSLEKTTGYQLLKAIDPNKDQSYFLYTLTQQVLSKTVFPLSDLYKDEVRRLAKNADFPNYQRKDSTGICFIGTRHFKNFLTRYLATEPGDIETPEKVVLGRHDGLMFYTLGQRQGLGIGGQTHAEAAPWYVAQKDIARNVLVVVQGEHHPLLYRTELTATECHWIADVLPFGSNHFSCSAKIRYRQPDQLCRVSITDFKRCKASFLTPQRAITPGQSVVFYCGSTCLGGGIID